jgi:glycosyltransferase involved in cell wall biosynthesis
MRVLMYPQLDQMTGEESGIRRVVEAYQRHLPAFGVELVKPGEPYDLVVSHAGAAQGKIDIAHNHGLYWSGDYAAANWELAANRNVIENIRHARLVTVPSRWVAETFQRDMHINPFVLGHGIDLEEWGTPEDQRQGYVLWNKNRTGDVCSPRPVIELARRRPDIRFLTTFTLEPAENIRVIGLQRHEAMRHIVKQAGVYLATTKETFGIGILEAMAAGVPVLGFRHGGILDIVQHGVNGYLAEPEDFEDLAEGLAYCIENNDVLGINGRSLVEGWTWEKAVERVADVYRIAMTMAEEKPTVGVVIPSYNYAGKVGRAIESTLQQTYPGLTQIVVVDDGSTDDTGLAVAPFAERDGRVRYIRQENAGVAVARNRGIAELATKYVSCLDADDQIEPLFLERCVTALEAEQDLGIAYTGLLTVSADGKEQVSTWPGAWDFDQQLQRRNQVPTCCVFRREMWARLGGYRQRYAPKGAGAEDGEFWLRAGAIGYRAAKVTEEPLFRYSYQTGRVSGDRSYREVDWLAWHPWAGSPRKADPPFASLAKPERWAHPVRAYDQPAISVVIPVGPGHEHVLLDALDSLEAQTFPRWEAIVVDDSGELVQDRYEKAFPFVRWLRTPGHKFGAGYARNLGAKHARAPLLVFLDADDWLYPQALELMMGAWNERGEIIYTDYVGKATIDDPSKLAEDLRQRIYARDEKTGQAVVGFRSADYDCARAIRQPEGGEPYLWCNVTCLIPKAWHDEIGGFDEKLKTWEDVEYHWRMAKLGKCYARLPVELLVYRFSTGFRRQLGLQTFEGVVEYIRAKHEELTIMGCGCKGGNAQTPKSQSSAPLRLMSTQQETEAMTTDADVMLIRYLHPNKGQHKVVGTATRTVYGFRAGGDTFLVKKADVQSQPHLFQVIQQPAASVPRPTAQAPRPPVPIEAPVPRSLAQFDPQEIPGIGVDIIKQLNQQGKMTLAQLKAMTQAEWVGLKGVGIKRAETIMAALKEMAG